MRKSFKLRLYPTKDQIKTFEMTLGVCCDLYNAALQERIEAYKLKRISLSLYDQFKELTELKKTSPEFKNIYCQVLRDPLRRVDTAFQRFFKSCKSNKKCGYPRYKAKKRYDSFCYWQDGFSISDKFIRLSKIGKIKIRVCQPEIKGAVKVCAIKREVDQWFAVLSCDSVSESYLPKTGESIGIDVGLERFATLSNGQQIDNPRFLKVLKAKLQRTQRKFSRAKKGSNRQKKQIVRIAKQHRKIRRQRRDFHFKIAVQLVRRFDTIHFEQLNIRNMVRNHRLASSISDVAWYQFQQIVAFKAAEAGKQVTFNNARNTSNECSVSGEIRKKKLSDRWHILPDGSKIHRDHNAAINILRRGERRQSVTVVQ